MEKNSEKKGPKRVKGVLINKGVSKGVSFINQVKGSVSSKGVSFINQYFLKGPVL